MRAFDGFVRSRDNVLGYWLNGAETLNLAQASLYFIEVLLADGILVSLTCPGSLAEFLTLPRILKTYRAYVVWNHRVWVFGFPVLCWLAAAGELVVFCWTAFLNVPITASSIFLIYNLSKTNTTLVDGREAGYQHNVNLWTTPTFVLSVA